MNPDLLFFIFKLIWYIFALVEAVYLFLHLSKKSEYRYYASYWSIAKIILCIVFACIIKFNEDKFVSGDWVPAFIQIVPPACLYVIFQSINHLIRRKNRT